jgi:hypothetical protein
MVWQGKRNNEPQSIRTSMVQHLYPCNQDTMRHPHTQILCWMLAMMLMVGNLAAQNERLDRRSIRDSSIQATSATTTQSIQGGSLRVTEATVRANWYWGTLGVAAGLNDVLLMRLSGSVAFHNNLITLRYSRGGAVGRGGGRRA